MEDNIEILLNGETRQMASGLSLTDLLHKLQLNEELIAIEVNREIIGRKDWSKYRLRSGDSIEIVHFVGGG